MFNSIDIEKNIPQEKQFVKDQIEDFGIAKDLSIFCADPFTGCSIDRNGDVFVCTCDGKLPVSVGHIMDFDCLEDFWQNPIAHCLQTTIIDGSFRYCDVKRCGILHNEHATRENFEQHKSQRTVFLNIDESCNLQCPSCRDEMIFVKNGSKLEQKITWIDHFHNIIKTYNGKLQIFTSGNGDPFASEIYQNFLTTCKLKQDQNFSFLTNGLLLKKRMQQNSSLINCTQVVMISMDAGSRDVYEDVRRPGKWITLLENLDYLKFLQDTHNIRAQLNFVIQKANYKDIPNFIELADRYEFRTHYAELEDWATGDGGFYKNNAVHLINHPEHNQYMEIVQQYKHKINLGR
jgi:sRNA-binding regulator protein Hfq